MNDEYAELKEITLTALDESGEEIKAFHKEMKIDLNDYDKVVALTQTSPKADFDKYLYKGVETESIVESLTFTTNYTLQGGDDIVLPFIVFPTEYFAKIQVDVKWIDNAGVEETTTQTVGWATGGSHPLAVGTNISVTSDKKWDTIVLGKSIGTEVTSLNENTDVRSWIVSAIQRGKEHIILGNAENLKLYDHALSSDTFVEKFGNDNTGLLIPAAASDKNIVIEAYLKDDNNTAFTPSFDKDYVAGNGSVTFILRNETLENTTVVLNDEKAAITLAGGSYKNVTVKKVETFKLDASADKLSLGDTVEANEIEIAGTVDELEASEDINPTIGKLVVAEEAVVPPIAAVNVPYVEINGTAGALTVYPTESGTVVKTGAGSNVASITTVDVTDSGKKYAFFDLNGTVTGNTGLNTQNAPVVRIAGAMTNVPVTVNATAKGTEVEIGYGAVIKSLAAVKDGANIFTSFVIDGRVNEGTLDTNGATDVTVGSKTKAEYDAVNDPAIVEANYAKVPALTTTGASNVKVGYMATVGYLTPDTATKIEINGTISNNAVSSNKIDTFILGKTGTIAKGAAATAELYLIPEHGTEVKLLGTLTGITRVRVGNLTDSLVTAATAASAYEVFNVPAVNMTLGAGAKGMNFNSCNGTVAITASAGTNSLPSIAFNTSPEADVTIASKAETALTSSIEDVKNITLVEGKFDNITLKAENKIDIQGVYSTTATDVKKNVFSGNLSLTAATVNIDQMTEFTGDQNERVTIKATGNVTIGGTEVQIVMFNQQILTVPKAGSFTMTNVKVGTVENYGTMTLNNCEITDAENMGAGLLEFNWDYTVDGTHPAPAIDDINPVTYNLVYDFDHRNLASDTRLKFFFKDPGNLDGSTVAAPSADVYGNRSTKALVNYKSDYADYKFDDFAKVLKREDDGND